MSSATPSAAGIPIQNDCPQQSCEVDEILAISTPVRPMIEPTDRSIPPVMITNAIPIPKIPSIAICRVVLTTLDWPRKSGLETHSPTHIRTRATSIPSSRLRWLIRELPFLLHRRGVHHHVQRQREQHPARDPSSASRSAPVWRDCAGESP